MVDDTVLAMVGQPGGWVSYSNSGGSVPVNPQASATFNYSGVQVGQISLSLLALGLLGLVTFYMWTRGVQK